MKYMSHTKKACKIKFYSDESLKNCIAAVKTDSIAQAYNCLLSDMNYIASSPSLENLFVVMGYEIYTNCNSFRRFLKKNPFAYGRGFYENLFGKLGSNCYYWTIEVLDK